MNQIFIKNTLIFLALILLLLGCNKEVEFSEIPQIEYISFSKIQQNGIDYQGVLKFSFTDKDGDIGLEKNDTLPPYDFNLFLTYFEKNNGKFIEYQFQDTNIPTNGRIPNLTPIGQNKSIKGIIEDTIFINDFDTTDLFDTLKFEVYIIDRALHKSNTITTPEIIVKKN